jgi:hypothetical protein
MFVSDRTFSASVESNPFFIETLHKDYFSPAYINTLKGLFVSVNNNFPDYGRYSEKNMDIFKDAGHKEDFLSSVYRDYTGNTDELINKIILVGHREGETDNDKNVGPRLLKKKNDLRSLLGNLSQINYSPYYGLNLLKT